MRLWLILPLVFLSVLSFSQNTEVDTALVRQYLNQAVSLKDQGKYPETQQKLSEAEILLKGGSGNAYAIYFLDLADIYFYVQNHEKALEYGRKALKSYKGRTPVDSLMLSKAYMVIGNVHNAQLMYDSSEIYNLEALDLLTTYREREKAIEDLARCYSNLGIIYTNKGDYQKSKSFKLKAMDIYEAKYGSTSPKIAIEYNNLGLLYDALGDYEKALSYKSQATQIWQDSLGLNHPYVGIGTSNVGLSYTRMGDHDKALEWFTKALYIKLLSFDSMHLQMVFPYNNIGVANVEKGEYQKGLYYFKKSLKILENNMGIDNQYGAYGFKNIGVIYQRLENYPLSIKNLNKALDIQLNEFGFKNPDVGKTLSTLGLSYYLLGEVVTSDSCYEQSLKALNYSSLDSLDQVNSVDELIAVVDEMSGIQLDRYKREANTPSLKEALILYEDLHEIIQYHRKLISPATKSFLSATVLPIYEKAIQSNFLALENASQEDSLKFKEQAFTFSETSKSLSLYDVLNEYEALKYSNIPDTLLEKDYQLRIDIALVDKDIRELSNKPSSNEIAEALKSLKQKKFDLNNQHEALKDLFREKYPDYYQLKYDQKIVSKSGLQESLAYDEAFLEYFVGDSSIFIFTITNNDFDVQQIKKDFPLEDWVTQMRSGIYNYWGNPARTPSKYKQTRNNYAEAAHLLYQKLIAPISQDLPEKLIIVPDGVLGYIPFDALLTAQVDLSKTSNLFPYLLMDHQISYAYSATLLLEMKEKRHRPTKNLLAFAPTFPENNTGAASILATRNGLGPLANNIPEVEAIQALIGGMALTDQKATLSNFLKEAAQYRILHLSTHGKADDRVGDYCFLAFQGAQLPSDSLLYVRDLYNLQLNADMVVLSACETGLGELQRGEGILSLARGFTYAGAKSIINSLWSVDDESTKQIMEHFYYHLKSGATKDAALRQAKLDYLGKGGDKIDPFFWAGFIPVGDMAPVKLGSGQWLWWGLGILLLSLSIIFVRRRKK